MRTFHILTHDPNPELQSVQDYELATLDDGPIFAGEAPASFPSGFEMKLGSGESHDFINNPLGWFVVSEKLAEALKPVWPGAFTPIPLTAADGTAIQGFALATVPTRVACLDRDKSNIRERRGRISSVENLHVVGAEVPDDVHVFVLAEFPSVTLVDDSVKAVIAESGARGMALIEVATTG